MEATSQGNALVGKENSKLLSRVGDVQINKLDDTVVPRIRPDQSKHECDADHFLSFLSD
ncbi:MAG: hypothetical protein WAT65_03480 [Candidatus Nanopelagicales bacterium]